MFLKKFVLFNKLNHNKKMRYIKHAGHILEISKLEVSLFKKSQSVSGICFRILEVEWVDYFLKKD